MANNMVPHHLIEGQLKFDPEQLDRWLYKHFDVISPQDQLDDHYSDLELDEGWES